MNEFNNLSVLPFYSSLSEQNAKKWWVFGRVYPLFAPAKFLLPFQIIDVFDAEPIEYVASLFKKENDGTWIHAGDVDEIAENVEYIDCGTYGVLAYNGNPLISNDLSEGQYYMVFACADAEYNEHSYYSEVFTVVQDMSPYVKVEWWDTQDLVFDAGRLVYKHNSTRFKQRLFLDSDIAKPDYIFEEEVEDRDGYTFPIKQISEKKFRFSFLASEYLLDVMRMADFVEITYEGKVFKPDSFLITPEWESEGDVAVVKAEFQTDTVVKKLGLGYLRPTGGQFNNDYNNDYNNLTE